MISLIDRYNQLKSDYESYQKMAEETMQKQSRKIIELDKKLDMLSLIVEISEYINKCLGSSEIVSMINDMMIGILGVTYSSVYILENRKLKLQCTNLSNTEHHYMIQDYNNKKDFSLNTCLINSLHNISKEDKVEIHSSILMPIYLKNNILGVVIVEHNIYNYLSEHHTQLLTALSNQLAICLENNRLYNQIRETSNRDSLTGLFNRKYFFSIMEKKCRCDEEPFAIVMIDIDNFKNCNDTFGHQYGDVVLRKVSKIIRDNLRKEDIVARYGGEEIIVYMYGIKNIKDVYCRMESIRKLIEETTIQYRNSKFNITVSMGISVAPDDNKDLEQLIREADINLYKAKNTGKNKIVC
ncbi:sensor domain-containing diguanylate cyclase [Clostridium sp. DJ247]|uniref:sensor domain-containing diguanylate cyclase n=1 Tax=Clostridium sp. DJ247 TaxID=2726188 RepID=UPI0016297B28|nr:sensor domain-containing diguanylate cyclase [Clostridium sp. DJ247]MBC2580810.1 sensor domain-containing diguanylate cyclase [Clostridium sp. DJ247]